MRVFLCLGLAIFAMHHFLKVGDSGSSESARVDFPNWFTPEEWTSEAREMNLEQCRKVVADLDEFIENPPTFL
jgi:hypothetical protein